MRVSSTWRVSYEFACHSAACRPPGSGGTGGSLPGGSMSNIHTGDLVQFRFGGRVEKGKVGRFSPSDPEGYVTVVRSGDSKQFMVPVGNVITEGEEKEKNPLSLGT